MNTFVARARALTPMQRAQVNLNSVHTPVATRWNTELTTMREIVKWQNEHVARNSGTKPTAQLQFAPLSAKDLQTLATGIAYLQDFEAATKLCEKDDACTLDVIAAVGAMRLRRGELLHQEVTGQFRLRLLSAPLVFVAFVCRCHNSSGDAANAVISFLKQVLRTQVVKHWCEHLGVSADRLSQEFGEFLRDSLFQLEAGRQMRDATRYSAAQLRADLKILHGKYATLTLFTKHVAGITASEASAERVFRRLKLSVRKDQKSMAGPTAEARCKLGVGFAALAATLHEEQAEEPEIERPAAVRVQLDDDAAEAATAAAGTAAAEAPDHTHEHQFFDACVFIVEHAAARISEFQQTLAQSARQAPTPATRCGKTTCFQRFNGTEHQADDFVRCCACGTFWGARCADVNLQELRVGAIDGGWRCETCAQKAAEPPFW